MGKLRLGQVDYANCLPVYTAIEEGIVPLNADIFKGHPTELNARFLEGNLDITPMSSIEYARNSGECLILPDLSISANGPVMSILLFSRVPVTELEGKTVCLPTSSATSVVLLKILLEHYYQVGVTYTTAKPDLDEMLAGSDAALLIGDDAMRADVRLRSPKSGPAGYGASWHEPGTKAGAAQTESGLYVTDLGEAWKEFTGEPMVFAVWVIHRIFAAEEPERVAEVANALKVSREWGLANPEHLLKVGHKRSPQFSRKYLEHYFETIKHGLDEDYRRALCCYFDYAYKSGLIPERVKLAVWGEVSDTGEDSRKGGQRKKAGA